MYEYFRVGKLTNQTKGFVFYNEKGEVEVDFETLAEVFENKYWLKKKLRTFNYENYIKS